MTTQLNGTEFTTLNTQSARRSTLPTMQLTLAARRDQRRVRRANRAL